MGRLIPPVLLLVYSMFFVYGAAAIPRFAWIEARRERETGSFLEGVAFGSAVLAPYALSLAACVFSFFLIAVFSSGRRK